jgi:hypothetical protein
MNKLGAASLLPLSLCAYGRADIVLGIYFNAPLDSPSHDAIMAMIITVAMIVTVLILSFSLFTDGYRARQMREDYEEPTPPRQISSKRSRATC